MRAYWLSNAQLDRRMPGRLKTGRLNDEGGKECFFSEFVAPKTMFSASKQVGGGADPLVPWIY